MPIHFSQMIRLCGLHILTALLVVVAIAPNMVGAKPRLAIVNLVPRMLPVEPGAGLPKGMPDRLRKPKEFEFVDAKLTRILIEEWARSSLLEQNKRGEKLGRRHNVQILVAGKVHAINYRGWVVSFVVLNGKPEASGGPKSAASPSEFFMILQEDDLSVGPVLADLARIFGFQSTLAANVDRTPVCEDALTGEEAGKLLAGRTLVFLDKLLVIIRKNGVREESDEQYLGERGNWWTEGNEICEHKPTMEYPTCRCLEMDIGAHHKFVWDSGAIQYVNIH